MRTNIFFFFVLLSSLFLISCDKEDKIVKPDCETFAEALIFLKSDSIKEVIDILTVDLNPVIKEDDTWGQKENINLLIERLNAQCENISASLGCYACILTLPPQSEIILTTDSAGVEIKRVIDILTPKDVIPKYVNVHEFHDE
ncbi:MAG TPA: hypothetical protein DER09_01685 [Prolixibacteraceae bacterium]|nr:hypothetical protein [Prolixibacteraceae bacterium]